MANKKIQGITVEIGGDTTKLGKAIADSEKQTRSLQGELREVEKLLQFDPGNTDLLAQRQKILAEAVESTTKKLDTLREAEAQVVEQFKKGDIGEDQLRAFQREIMKTESELDGFADKLNGTKDDIKDVGETAEQSGDGFTVMKGALADMVSNVIQSAISSIRDLVGSLLELSEATEEYRTMQAKLEGSSKTFGYSMEFANDKYEQFYKYVGDDQMATNAITNLMGLGTSTENISKIADGAIGVWASYGDSIPIESLTESINETINAGKVTGTFADTINWAKDSNEQLNNALNGNKDAQKAYNDAIKEGLPVEDAFNEALAKISDEQERADVVAQFLNSTYGESKTTYDELNKSVTDANEAELNLKDTQAQLGETVAPVNTALTDMKNQALEAITPLVEKLADGFMRLYEWLQKNPTVMTILTGIAIALASAFTVLAGALAIQGIITGVTKAIAFLNTTLLANPIVLITALIVGLVAGFIYLWNNCDAFRQFWVNLWNGIRSITNTVVTALINFFTVTIPNAWNTFTNYLSNTYSKIVSSISNMISNVVNTAKSLPEKIYNSIAGAIGRIVSWGSEMISKAKTAMSELVTTAVSTVKSLPNKLKSIGGDVVRGLWNGIKDKNEWLKSKIKEWVGNVTKWLKSMFGIKSPSTVMRDEIGRYFSEGIGVGITDNIDKPINALKEVKDNMLGDLNDLNGATINRKLSTTFNGSAVNVPGNNVIISELKNIYDRLGRMQIVLDTGTLVGETIDKIDAGLASNQLLRARGV